MCSRVFETQALPCCGITVDQLPELERNLTLLRLSIEDKHKYWCIIICFQCFSSRVQELWSYFVSQSFDLTCLVTCSPAHRLQTDQLVERLWLECCASEWAWFGKDPEWYGVVGAGSKCVIHSPLCERDHFRPLYFTPSSCAFLHSVFLILSFFLSISLYFFSHHLSLFLMPPPPKKKSGNIPILSVSFSFSPSPFNLLSFFVSIPPVFFLALSLRGNYRLMWD